MISVAALTARPYTRRVTPPPDDPPPTAELLDRARTLITSAHELIEAAEAQIAATPAAPREQAATDARAAVDLHEQAKTAGAAAQSAMYAAVRRLRRLGVSRADIRQATGLTAALVKWIVEHHAEARRARRMRQTDPNG